MPSAVIKNAVSVDVGTRLRQLREARKVSLRALAHTSGLSANALSMIERGMSSPSVSTLYRLADALEIPITDFFSPNAELQKVVFIKAEERTRLPFLRGLWEGLGGEQFTGRVMPFMITLENGASSGPALMISGSWGKRSAAETNAQAKRRKTLSPIHERDDEGGATARLVMGSPNAIRETDHMIDYPTLSR